MRLIPALFMVCCLSTVYGQDEVRDRIKRADGARFQGRVTDCVDGEILLTSTFAAYGESTTTLRKFRCSDVAAVDLVEPNAALQERILRAALCVQNGTLAYSVACSMRGDSSLRSMSCGQEMAQAVAEYGAACSRYTPAKKTLDDLKTRLANEQREWQELDRTYSGTRDVNRPDVVARRTRLGAEGTKLQSRIFKLEGEITPDRKAYEEATRRLQSYCQRILQQARLLELVDEAKLAIIKDDAKDAVNKLQEAVALPNTIDKTQAVSLLKETRIAYFLPQDAQRGRGFVPSPAQVLATMNDADFRTLSSTNDLPVHLKLSYEPLNARYVERLLAAKDGEMLRRERSRTFKKDDGFLVIGGTPPRDGSITLGDGTVLNPGQGRSIPDGTNFNLPSRILPKGMTLDQAQRRSGQGRAASDGTTLVLPEKGN